MKKDLKKARTENWLCFGVEHAKHLLSVTELAVAFFWFHAASRRVHAVQPPWSMSCCLSWFPAVGRRCHRGLVKPEDQQTERHFDADARRCGARCARARRRYTQMTLKVPPATGRDCETKTDLGKRLPSRGRFNCNESGETQRECKSTPICVARVSGRICAHLRRSAVPSLCTAMPLRIRLETPLYRSAG